AEEETLRFPWERVGERLASALSLLRHQVVAHLAHALGRLRDALGARTRGVVLREAVEGHHAVARVDLDLEDAQVRVLQDVRLDGGGDRRIRERRARFLAGVVRAILRTGGLALLLGGGSGGVDALAGIGERLLGLAARIRQRVLRLRERVVGLVAHLGAGAVGALHVLAVARGERERAKRGGERRAGDSVRHFRTPAVGGVGSGSYYRSRAENVGGARKSMSVRADTAVSDESDAGMSASLVAGRAGFRQSPRGRLLNLARWVGGASACAASTIRDVTTNPPSNSQSQRRSPCAAAANRTPSPVTSRTSCPMHRIS